MRSDRHFLIYCQTRKLISTAASNAGCLLCDVTLTFDLLTPKSCSKMHQWQKFGGNPSTDAGDIADTYSLGWTAEACKTYSFWWRRLKTFTFIYCIYLSAFCCCSLENKRSFHAEKKTCCNSPQSFLIPWGLSLTYLGRSQSVKRNITAVKITQWTACTTVHSEIKPLAFLILHPDIIFHIA